MSMRLKRWLSVRESFRLEPSLPTQHPFSANQPNDHSAYFTSVEETVSTGALALKT